MEQNLIYQPFDLGIRIVATQPSPDRCTELITLQLSERQPHSNLISQAAHNADTGGWMTSSQPKQGDEPWPDLFFALWDFIDAPQATKPESD